MNNQNYSVKQVKTCFFILMCYCKRKIQMKKIGILVLIISLVFVSCQNTSRTYVKRTDGTVVVTSQFPDGTEIIEDYHDPKINQLKDLGLSEEDAVQLVVNGVSAESNSREPTTLGVIIIIIVVFIFIIAVSSGDGFF